MMYDAMERLRGLYGEYLRDMARCERERRNIRGAFSSILGGAGAGADSCNDRFSEGLRACLEEFAASGPSSAGALAVMRYVVEQPRVRSCSQAARLMLQAAEGFLIPLAERLDPGDAGELLALCAHAQDGQAPLPVQKALVRALKAKAQ